MFDVSNVPLELLCSLLMGCRDGGGGEGKTNPFPVAVFVLLVRFVEIHAVQTADCECHDYLHEAEDGVRNVGEGHLDAVEDTHFVCLCSYAVMFCIVLYPSFRV